MRIRTPDQRLRVFVSSTLAELAPERAAVRRAVERLHLIPVMFELGARPYPPRDLYRAYLAQSDVFVGIYWQSYGWVAPGEEVSGLEDEFLLSAGMPRLLYVREPAPDRQDRLEELLEGVRREGLAAYRVVGSPEELEAVAADDLALLLSERFAAAVPAPAAPPPPPAAGGLIAPDNPLVGRDEELAAVLALLRDPGVRLVTMIGPGGIGKSRLALEVVGRAQADHPDGVWTVLLEAVREPALVLPAIASTLKVQLTAGEEPLAGLSAHLADRRVLLVLDNVEQVLGAAPEVAALLRSCPGLTVLTTSRSPLQVRGEHLFPVGPLPVPDPDTATPEALAAASAVRLFLDRVAARGAPMARWEPELRTVAAICRSLDGIPLALEFAAARARLLAPADLLARLDRRLPLLTGGTRDAPARHRTLRATIDWGYDLLAPPERAALDRLAVFSGGWTLGAAEHVLPAAGGLGEDVLALLEGLLRASFVNVSPVAGPEPRFGLLETIREYAGERLAGGPARAVCEQAHAAYFLAFAEQAAPQTHGTEQAAWLDALERDHGNLRAALNGFAQRGDHDGLVRLAVALGRFWLVHYHIGEALDWLRRARDAAGDRQDAAAADVRSWLGIIAGERGDLDLAEAAHREALPLRGALGDEHGEHVEILSLGNVAFMRGDLPTAVRRWRMVIRLTEERGDNDVLARALANAAYANYLGGDAVQARPDLERAAALHRGTGDLHAAVTADLNLAAVLIELGERERARALARDSLREAVVLGDRTQMLEALEALGGASALEHPRRAAWLLGAVDSLRRRLRLPLVPVERPSRRRWADHARAAAQAAGVNFDDAWREGAAASLESATAAALAD